MRELRRPGVPSRTQALLTVALLSLISTGAMLGLTNRADERWHPYVFGPETLADPTLVVVEPIRIAVGSISNFGNFRPLGRMVEHVNYAVDEVLAITTGLPLHVVLGLVRMFSAVLLGVVLVAAVHRLVGRGTLVPFAVAGAFPGLLVAYGALSSMVVFSGMYLQTTVLVVVAIWIFAPPDLYRPQDRGGSPPRARALVGYAGFGLAIATFNELAYIAAPVAGATVLLLLMTSGVPWRRWWSVPATRLAAAAGAGFLVAAVPLRLYLAAVCAGQDASCYVASDPAPGGMTVELFVNRIIAGLPLASWRSGPFFDELTMIAVIAAGAIVVVALVLRLVRPTAAAGGAPDAGADDGDRNGAEQRPWWVPVAVGAVIVLCAATVASLSPVIQDARNPWQGWREAPVMFTGWALVLGGLAGAAADRVRRPWGLRALVVVASLGVGAAVIGTTFQHHRDSRDARLVLTEKFGVEIASFEQSEAGDERRCDLLDDFERLHEGLESQVRRMREAAQVVAQLRHGSPFCGEETTDG